MAAVYDTIGLEYRRHRHPDARIATQVLRGLGDVDSVLNVGAGTGSYEPNGPFVVAIEPSEVMRAQRPAGAAPCVAAIAGALPIADDSFDAALVVLSLHHWPDPLAGLRELARVARRRVVLLTFDPRVHASFWLVADYLPQSANLPGSHPPTPVALLEALGGEGRVETVLVPHDCTDAFMGASWRRPERYLDPVVQSCASGIAQLPAAVVEQAMARLAEDLGTEVWHERHGGLLDRDALDVGIRLVVADLR